LANIQLSCKTNYILNQNPISQINIREKATISKRGRKRLRVILFQGILPVAATGEEFQELPQYYTVREQKRLPMSFR
jgi:hypothetical protein